MKSEPGTYALVLQNRSNAKIQIGRWRAIDFERGYYSYIGSAFGPGGVQGRLSRHLRKSKRMHWHIDYLLESFRPVAAWYSHDADRLEHRWAEVFRGMRDTVPICGFGCSDCKCYSHLFRTSTPPDLTQFSEVAGGHVETWSYRCAA